MCSDQRWPCRDEQRPERGAARARAQGRAQFELYQKLLALAFAVVQAIGQLSLLRPYVADWSPGWLLDSTVTLVAGAMILVHARPPLARLAHRITPHIPAVLQRPGMFPHARVVPTGLAAVAPGWRSCSSSRAMAAPAMHCSCRAGACAHGSARTGTLHA